MSQCSAEFMVEPFVEGLIGPAVLAAIDAVAKHGFEPSIGAFGTTIEGATDEVVTALGDMLNAAMEAGSTRVTVQIDCGRAS